MPLTYRIDPDAGLLIVSVHRALPFMVLLLANAMSRIDLEWIECAQACGASPGRVLRTIVLPLSVPGVPSDEPATRMIRLPGEAKSRSRTNRSTRSTSAAISAGAAISCGITP